MAITASIGGSQGGDFPYTWRIEYDDVTRRVTGDATADSHIAAITVVVTITTGGGTRKVQFVRSGRAADADTDFAVTIGAGPTLIGPTIAPNQVARIVGKIGSSQGGLPFEETSSRV